MSTGNNESFEFDDPRRMNQSLAPDMEVRDKDGESIGTVTQVYRPVGVDEINSQTSDVFMRVDRGGFGIMVDLYIPASFVTDIQGDEIWIKISSDQIGDMTWDQPPVPLPEE